MDFYNFENYLYGIGRSGGEWLIEKTGMRLYVRRNLRVLGGYDIANIILDEENQKQGIFTNFIKKYAYLPLRVENVYNPYLDTFLYRQPDWEREDKEHFGPGGNFINKPFALGLQILKRTAKM